jgi:hypothetical protein
MEQPIFLPKPLKLSPAIQRITLTVFAVMLVIFIPVYHWEPFPERLNDNIIYFIDLFAALTAAAYGTLLARQFAPGEPPRRIWLTFVIGWWSAVLAEVLWIVYSFLTPEFPPFTLIDVAWLAAYFCLGLSLYYQYRLIFGKKRPPYEYLIVIALILVFSAALTNLAQKAGLGEGISWLVLFLAILYPVSDILLGIYALRLSLLFGRGRLGRPWWGLISFAIADSINIYFWMGGYKLMPVQVSNYFFLLSDVCYLGGYMITALGLLSILLLLREKSAQEGAAA